MIAVTLWILATLDAAFVGYREAAGRSALINKRDYYRKAMFRGAVFGQIAVGIVLFFIAVTILLSSERWILIAELEKCSSRMLWVYMPFALIILTAFIVRMIPSVDIKSITSTLIFGPFTLLRPLVIGGGAAYGFFAAPSTAVFLLGGLILCLTLGLEWTIGRLRKRNLIS
jgi:hypothetical protein